MINVFIKRIFAAWRAFKNFQPEQSRVSQRTVKTPLGRFIISNTEDNREQMTVYLFEMTRPITSISLLYKAAEGFINLIGTPPPVINQTYLKPKIDFNIIDNDGKVDERILTTAIILISIQDEIARINSDWPYETKISY